jgi:putative redox protein
MLSLQWIEGLRFRNAEGSPAIDLASSVPGMTSPVQALAYAVMGCMGMDIAYVVRKHRRVLQAMTVRFEGDRAETHPRRFTTMRLHFDLTGAIEPHIVERAIALSKAKYCSVWNTIRPDVELTATFAVHDA